MLVLALAGLLLALIIGWVTARLIATPLRDTAHVLEAVAMGDLTQRVTVDSQDEVGRIAVALNRAVESLATMAKVAETIAHGDLTVEPAVLSRRLDHGVLAAHVERRHGHGDGGPDGGDHVEVGERGLHHHHVCTLGNVEGDHRDG